MATLPNAFFHRHDVPRPVARPVAASTQPDTSDMLRVDLVTMPNVEEAIDGAVHVATAGVGLE